MLCLKDMHIIIALQLFQFFSPIQPVRCEFEFGENGRPTGEANVDFATHQEALEAMKKHRKNMRKNDLLLTVTEYLIPDAWGGGEEEEGGCVSGNM